MIENEPDLTKPWCYFVSPGQNPAEHGGYVPYLVVEGCPQAWPMLGRGEGAAPWVWGQDLAKAEEVCRKANADRGISPEEADRIVASSMRAALSQGGRP